MRNKQIFGQLFHPAKIQTYKKLLSYLAAGLVISILSLIAAFSITAIVALVAVNSIELYTGKTRDEIIREADPDFLYWQKTEEEAKKFQSRYNQK